MTAYQIKLCGCDDSTAFVMELTDAEAALLQRVATLSSETADYGCQPEMVIAEYRCICGPDGNGEPDCRDDCPLHGTDAAYDAVASAIGEVPF